MKEEKKLETIKQIEICMGVIKKINKHFKKTNWLCLKNYVEIIEIAKKLQKNGTNPKKPKSN